MNTLENSDCCFKGPTTTIPVPGAPRSVAVTLRQKFDLYANIRPTKTYDRLTPNRKLDCVCFREATEGLYTGVETKITDDAANAMTVIDLRGKCSDTHSAVREPQNEPAAEKPNTATYPVVFNPYAESTSSETLAIQIPKMNRWLAVAYIANLVFGMLSWRIIGITCPRDALLMPFPKSIEMCPNKHDARS